MPKLRLKRTPEEEAAHRFRKKQRRDGRDKREDDRHGRPPHSRSRVVDNTPSWASSNDDLQADHNLGTSSTSSCKREYHDDEYERLCADLEERAFQAKMFAVYEDEERLDSIEAQFNDFVHIPRRWKNYDFKQTNDAANANNLDVDDFLKMDPRHMDDDEYAEWVRLGMHRKTHPDLYAEQQRKKMAKAQRKEEEKARRSETRRLEKLAEEKRQRKKLARDVYQRQYAIREYELRWKVLMSERASDDPGRPLRFNDIPWPILSAYTRRPCERQTDLDHTIAVEDLTPKAILDFLLPPIASSTTNVTEGDTSKQRKDRLRDTFLRFHPDKFEGRFMTLITDSERSIVREAISQVVRSLNSLTKEQA